MTFDRTNGNLYTKTKHRFTYEELKDRPTYFVLKVHSGFSIFNVRLSKGNQLW